MGNTPEDIADAEIAELRAEIERLRAALTEAAGWFEGEGMHRQADAVLEHLNQQNAEPK